MAIEFTQVSPFEVLAKGYGLKLGEKFNLVFTITDNYAKEGDLLPGCPYCFDSEKEGFFNATGLDSENALYSLLRGDVLAQKILLSPEDKLLLKTLVDSCNSPTSTFGVRYSDEAKANVLVLAYVEETGVSYINSSHAFKEGMFLNLILDEDYDYTPEVVR